MTMAHDPSGKANGWQVISVTARTAAGQTGKFVAGKTVAFRLDTGTTGAVFIPDTQFSEDNARTLIAREAETMAKVAALHG